MRRQFKLPDAIPHEPVLVVSRSQLTALLQATRAECNIDGPMPGSTVQAAKTLPVLDCNLPTNFRVEVIDEHTVLVSATFDGVPATTRVQSNGFTAERMLHALAMHFLHVRGDELDYKEAYEARTQDISELSHQMDVALNGEANSAAQPSLADIAAQICGAARRRGKPLLAD